MLGAFFGPAVNRSVFRHLRHYGRAGSRGSKCTRWYCRLSLLLVGGRRTARIYLVGDSEGSMPVKTTKSTKSSEVVLFPQQPALRLIYDTAPMGLACLSLDCRYLQINQRLTEICGISVEDHLGRSVRECVPALADSVEAIVRSIMETGEPVIGIEVAGQRTDQVEDRYWVTYWHPLPSPRGKLVPAPVPPAQLTV